MLIHGKILYKDDSQVSNDLLAEKFSELFDLEYKDVIKDLSSTSSVVTIAKKVSNNKSEELQKWMELNNITSGINIDEDTKRTYPYDSLAAHLIGFCGSDNQGLEGLEAEWDDTLKGTFGRIVATTDVNKNIISDESEQYIPAENGSDIYLTIDVNAQSVAEKYLKQAVEENKADSGTVIIMDPTDGDILTMANYPTYNLNEPFEPNTPELKKTWDDLSNDEQAEATYAMWRNSAVSDGYEPGSTFKIVTASIALEEGLVETDKKQFTCNRVMTVADRKISCWASSAHGSLTLREALEKSCNPSFIQVGQKIGVSTFYKYIDAFGLRGKTGARVSGEASGYFYNEEDCGPVELATMSFDQRFTITPLQLITTVCGIVNDGKVMQPRIVYKTVNSDTGVTTNIDPVEVRQVISEETSATMRDLLKSVVESGTATYCKISGIDVAAKTGTTDENYDKWLCGFTPYYTAVTWFGFDQNESIYYNNQNPAGIIWANVMSRIHSGLENARYVMPSKVAVTTICTDTGMVANSGCKNTNIEYFLWGTVPEECTKHSGSKITTNNKKEENKGVYVDDGEELELNPNDEEDLKLDSDDEKENNTNNEVKNQDNDDEIVDIVENEENNIEETVINEIENEPVETNEINDVINPGEDEEQLNNKVDNIESEENLVLTN